MRRTGTRVTGGLLAAACAAVVMAGAAGGISSAKQLVTRAIAATEAARSLTFAGTVVESNTTISLRVSADRVTGAGQGSLTIGSGTALMRAVGGTIYINADSAFWTSTSGASTAQELAGRWVSTSATSTDGKSLAVFVSETSFLQNVFNPNLKSSAFSTAGTATVNGQKATVIRGRQAKNNAVGSVYVASSGTPYILKLTLTSTAGHGALTFSGFNKPVHPVVPTGAINLDTLGSSSG